MYVPVIGFIPPHVGLEGHFNTFRLGMALTKRLTPGMTVFLMCQKTMTVFGSAEVISIATGPLAAMCLEHGVGNHTELATTNPLDSPKRLFDLVCKIYGPHIASESKKTTVVFLRRHDEFGTAQYDAFRQVQRPNN